MSTKWVVTTAAERIVLNGARQGETTFTVTNPGGRADRAVFEPVPGDGADASWFTVDEPQRRVAAAASVSYLLRTQVPDGAPPGQYEVQGRVYSADSAPEESSVLSGRVVFEVAAPPAPQQRRIPWWIIAVAAGLVVVTVVVVVLVATLGGGETPQAAQSAPPVAPSGPVTVPDVAKLNEANASFTIKQAGLSIGTVKHRQDPSRPDQVIEQSVAAGTTLAKGDKVNLVIAVSLKAPAQKTAAGALIKFYDGRLEWDQAEPYVTRWSVTATPTMCMGPVPVALGQWPGGCNSAPVMMARVDAKSWSPPIRTTQFGISGSVVTFNGSFGWNVAAMDDFGNVGPYSPVLPAQMVS